MKILIINGPNLNMLGTRETNIYGNETLDDLYCMIEKEFECEFEFFQSNHEGDIIDKIHGAQGNFDGVVINPGAYTHYSYAISDAIKCVDLDFVEVHISNIHKREEFRSTSVTAKNCVGQISGLGFYGYILAINYLLNR